MSVQRFWRDRSYDNERWKNDPHLADDVRRWRSRQLSTSDIAWYLGIRSQAGYQQFRSWCAEGMGLLRDLREHLSDHELVQVNG